MDRFAPCWKATAFASKPAPCMSETPPLRRGAVTGGSSPRSREALPCLLATSTHRSWKIWNVSTPLACRTLSRPRGCEGDCRRGRGLEHDDGRSNGEIGRASCREREKRLVDGGA